MEGVGGRRVDAVTILKQSDFFHGLSEKHLRTLAKTCTHQSVPKREYLFHEGQRGGCLYALAEGSIQLTKSTEEGKEIVIKTVKPGETFADVILFESERYPVSAVALNRSVVYCIPKEGILRLLENRGFREEFVRVLLRRLKYLTERILYLTSRDVETRFFGFLKEHYGERDSYTLTLSKKDIAAEIGSTPETLSRLIDRLGKEGTLAWKGKTVKLRAGFWTSHG